MSTAKIKAELAIKRPTWYYKHAIILSRWLDQLGTDLTIQSVGTPTLIAGDDSALTADGEAANASAYTSRKTGVDHPAGEVIFVDLSGGTSGVNYEVEIPFTVDGSQNLSVILPVNVL